MHTTLYFDSDCGICNKFAKLLKGLKLNSQICPSFSTPEFLIYVDLDRFDKEIAFVDSFGSVKYGVAAIGSALKTSSYGIVKSLGFFLSSEFGVKYLNGIYLFISSNRWRFPGSSCNIKK